MARSHFVSITNAVGTGGANRDHDVRAIQQLINEHLPMGLRHLEVDGVAGPKTEAAIVAWQRHFLRLPHPDGRVDPQGPTLRALNASQPAIPPRPRATPPKTTITPPGRAAPTTGGGGARPTGAPRAPTTPQSGYPVEVITAAQTAQAKTGIPAAITLSQWALESGHGQHMPGGSNNPFGIKARAGQPYVEARTREVIAGRSVYIEARFRKFDSRGDAFEQHGELLATGRPYAHARTLLPNDNAFADALTGVYATDPNYGTLLKSIMRSANLYQYD